MPKKLTEPTVLLTVFIVLVPFFPINEAKADWTPGERVVVFLDANCPITSPTPGGKVVWYNGINTIVYEMGDNYYPTSVDLGDVDGDGLVEAVVEGILNQPGSAPPYLWIIRENSMDVISEPYQLDTNPNFDVVGGIAVPPSHWVTLEDIDNDETDEIFLMRGLMDIATRVIMPKGATVQMVPQGHVLLLKIGPYGRRLQDLMADIINSTEFPFVTYDKRYPYQSIPSLSELEQYDAVFVIGDGEDGYWHCNENDKLYQYWQNGGNIWVEAADLGWEQWQFYGGRCVHFGSGETDPFWTDVLRADFYTNAGSTTVNYRVVNPTHPLMQGLPPTWSGWSYYPDCTREINGGVKLVEDTNACSSPSNAALIVWDGNPPSTGHRTQASIFIPYSITTYWPGKCPGELCWPQEVIEQLFRNAIHFFLDVPMVVEIDTPPGTTEGDALELFEVRSNGLQRVWQVTGYEFLPLDNYGIKFMRDDNSKYLVVSGLDSSGQTHILKIDPISGSILEDLALGAFPGGFDCGDLNGDGTDEVLVSTWGSPTLQVLNSDLDQVASWDSGGLGLSVKVADIDGDKMGEIVVVSVHSTEAEVRVYTLELSGNSLSEVWEYSFAIPPTWIDPLLWSILKPIDHDLDGRDELVLALGTVASKSLPPLVMDLTNSVVIWLDEGGNEIQSYEFGTSGREGGPSSIEVGDISPGAPMLEIAIGTTRLSYSIFQDHDCWAGFQSLGLETPLDYSTVGNDDYPDLGVWTCPDKSVAVSLAKLEVRRNRDFQEYTTRRLELVAANFDPRHNRWQVYLETEAPFDRQFPGVAIWRWIVSIDCGKYPWEISVYKEVSGERIAVTIPKWYVNQHVFSKTEASKGLNQWLIEKKWVTSPPEKVIIARNDLAVDSAAISAYASKTGDPIVLVSPDEIPKESRDFLISLPVRRALIVGGPEAVSPEVEMELKAMGFQVERIGGKDRFETAKLIAENLWGISDKAVIAPAPFEGDVSLTLVAVPYAHSLGAPLLFTNGDEIPEYTREALENLGVKETVVIGANVSEDLLLMGIYSDTIAGKDKYETSVLVANRLKERLHMRSVALINGEDPGAFNGAQVAALKDGVVLLVKDRELPEGVGEFLGKYKFKIRWIFFTGSIPPEVEREIIDVMKPRGTF